MSRINYIRNILFLAVLLFSFSCRKSDIVVDLSTSVKDDGRGTGSITWKKIKILYWTVSYL